MTCLLFRCFWSTTAGVCPFGLLAVYAAGVQGSALIIMLI